MIRPRVLMPRGFAAVALSALPTSSTLAVPLASAGAAPAGGGALTLIYACQHPRVRLILVYIWHGFRWMYGVSRKVYMNSEKDACGISIKTPARESSETNLLVETSDKWRSMNSVA